MMDSLDKKDLGWCSITRDIILFVPRILAQNLINHVLDKLLTKAEITYILVPSDRCPHVMSLVAESDFPQPPLEAQNT